MTQKADMRGKEKLDDVMGQKFLLLRIFAYIVVQLNFTHRRVKCSYLPNHAASVLARSHAVGEPATSYKFRELIRPRPGLFWVRLVSQGPLDASYTFTVVPGARTDEWRLRVGLRAQTAMTPLTSSFLFLLYLLFEIPTGFAELESNLLPSLCRLDLDFRTRLNELDGLMSVESTSGFSFPRREPLPESAAKSDFTGTDFF